MSPCVSELSSTVPGPWPAQPDQEVRKEMREIKETVSLESRRAPLTQEHPWTGPVSHPSQASSWTTATPSQRGSGVGDLVTCHNPPDKASGYSGGIWRAEEVVKASPSLPPGRG